jgi:hypothetical protein
VIPHTSISFFSLSLPSLIPHIFFLLFFYSVTKKFLFRTNDTEHTNPLPYP